MLFSSGIFLFLYLPCVLALYFGLPARCRNAVLIVASLGFYAWTEPVFIFWALASALLDFFLGAILSAPDRSANLRRFSLTLGIIANLALLAWFKYAVFASTVFASLQKLAGFQPFNVLHGIILPVAISFIVFEKITYLVDIYRGSGHPAHSVWDYLLYVFYFPKLLAGPIIRYCDIEPELARRQIASTDIRDGTTRFIVGLGKKVLIADHVSNLADKVFALPASSLDTPTAWVGVICFTFQIYFDFSGYSDMAIGLSRIFGFHLRENFLDPYLALNFTDFWRRWHISLSTWIREYLYIPLGGNRKSTTRTYINLCVCFILSGLWHGAAWPFIIWGCLHGVMLTIDRLFWLNLQKRVPRAVNWLITLFLVMISWVIFRSTDIPQMVAVLSHLFTPWRPLMANQIWLSPDITLVLIVAAFIVLRKSIPPWTRLAAALSNENWFPAGQLAGCIVLLTLAVARLSVDSYHAFLYFRF